MQPHSQSADAFLQPLSGTKGGFLKGVKYNYHRQPVGGGLGACQLSVGLSQDWRPATHLGNSKLLS